MLRKVSRSKRLLIQEDTPTILFMAFIAKDSRLKVQMLPVTTSTVLAKNSLVTFTSGLLVAATAGTASVDIAGIYDSKAIAATDSDYATARLIAVKVPTGRHFLVEADVTSGLVAGDIGGEFDLTDASTVSRAASSVDVVKCIRVISTTKGLFWLKVNGAY